MRDLQSLPSLCQPDSRGDGCVSQTGAPCTWGYLEACWTVNHTRLVYLFIYFLLSLKFVWGKAEPGSFCAAVFQQYTGTAGTSKMLACMSICNWALKEQTNEKDSDVASLVAFGANAVLFCCFFFFFCQDAAIPPWQKLEQSVQYISPSASVTSMNNKRSATISNYANRRGDPDIGVFVADLNADVLIV